MTEVTTVCSLWDLTFRNGRHIRLSDHDAVIMYQGGHYLPQNSAQAILTEQRVGLSVDSGGLKTRLTLDDLTAQDIRDGALDGATLREYRHDWRSGETQLLFKGRVGDVSVSGASAEIEWLGQASLLDRTTGRVFSRQCDASFGDRRCELNAQDFPEGTSCVRSFVVCRDQFSNTINFRGFPYLLGDDFLQAGVKDSDPRDGSSRYA